MVSIKKEKLVEIVNELSSAMYSFEDCYDFMATAKGHPPFQSIKWLEDKSENFVSAWRAIDELEKHLEDLGYKRTEDTKRYLQDGEGAFYCESDGTWYDNWIRLIADCYKSGMTKEEIEESLDLENNGFIFYTEFEL